MHFATLVIYDGELGDYVERVTELLEPFRHENPVKKSIITTRKEIEEDRVLMTEELEQTIKEGEGEMLCKLSPFKELRNDPGMSFTQYAKVRFGKEPDKNGDIWGFINPDSRWDWHTIGGSYALALIRKDGTGTEAAYARDIDWDETRKKSGRDRFSTVAVCTKDGWFERTSHEDARWEDEFEGMFIRNLTENSVVVIVDCHR